MTTPVSLSNPPILQFFNNLGQPNAGGYILTQVGGVNYATYQDSVGTTPLPNPIPLNSRGEISNAAGASCQLFLQTGVAYTFTLYDPLGNIINVSNYVVAGYTLYAAITSNTGSVVLPSGTSAQRDTTPAAGYFRFNSTIGVLEIFNGTVWETVAGSYSGYASYSANQVLTAAQAGNLILFSGSTAAQTVTLPLRTPMGVGQSFFIVNTSSVPVTVAANGADSINANSPGVGVVNVASIVLSPGDSVGLINNGYLWQEQQGVRASALQVSVQGGFKNLQGNANGTTAAVNYSYDSLMLRSASGTYVNLLNGNLAASTGAASGVVNSLDTGAWAYSTWYYVFVVYGTGGTGLLFSLSATAPTLPTGYTYFARVGAIRIQSATSYYPLAFKQYGRRVQYVVGASGNVIALPLMASGSFGTLSVTYAAISVTAYVPPTASKIQFMGAGNISSGLQTVQVAPNPNYGSPSGATNQVPWSNGAAGWGQVLAAIVGEMVIESSNIYGASNGGSIACMGWEDNL